MDALLSLLLSLSLNPPDLSYNEPYVLSETLQEKYKDSRKCPEYNNLKNNLTEYDPSLISISGYSLCFVYNANVRVTCTVVKATPYKWSGDSDPRKNIRIPMEYAFPYASNPASQLIDSNSVDDIPGDVIVPDLLQFLDDPERAWAAHILLATMTRKNGAVSPCSSTPEEWWENEGKTGKAKKEWSENFFNKPGYQLYRKVKNSFRGVPNGYFFICPPTRCDPLDRS
jgi:hypothetical protein